MGNAACVVTSEGVIDAEVGVASPYIVDSGSSSLTVRIGPRFYASDAYLVAYDYCLGRGMYAYEVTPWAHSATYIRDLRYDCRPTYIAPPLVYHVDRSNRYRYDYFRNYYRNHRPGYHYRTEPSRNSWWGKGAPTHPPTVTHPPRHSRDGRATTPPSPWSYNPNKNNRYQPRVTTPPKSTPVTRPGGWWGRGSSTSSSTKPPKYETPTVPSSPSKPKSGFWGSVDKKSTSTPSVRSYSSETSNRGSNRFTPRSVETGTSRGGNAGGGGSKPGWFGK